MQRVVFGLMALLLLAAPARAQVAATPTAAPYRSITFADQSATIQPSGAHGFTVMVNIGLGFEHDYFYGGGVGLAGLNFGIGGFVTPRLAILARLSGTVVEYDDPVVTGLKRSQNSSVFGATAQYWATPRVAIEAGGGFGQWSDETGAADAGWGLILGGSVIVFEHGSQHLLVGAEYAPVLTAAGTVHNVGVTFAYQFFRR